MSWLADIPELEGLRALDVATGSGRFAFELATRYAEVVGIDRAEGLSAGEPHPRVSFMAMDAEALAFPDAHFDLVAISWGLHHLANPTGVLTEMRRVLAPGGIFLLVEPIKVFQGTNQDLHLLAHGLIARVDAARGKDHFPIYERLQVGSIIQGLGLEAIQFHPQLAVEAEGAWDTARCIETASKWIEKLEAIAGDVTVAVPEREEAAALVARLRREGMRTCPVMVTFGRKPVKASVPAWSG